MGDRKHEAKRHMYAISVCADFLECEVFFQEQRIEARKASELAAYGTLDPTKQIIIDVSDAMGGRPQREITAAPRAVHPLARAHLMTMLKAIDRLKRLAVIYGIDPTPIIRLGNNFNPYLDNVPADASAAIEAIATFAEVRSGEVIAQADEDIGTSSEEVTWITVKDAAPLAAVSMSAITQAANENRIRHNGKEGSDRRLDAASVALYAVRKHRERDADDRRRDGDAEPDRALAKRIADARAAKRDGVIKRRLSSEDFSPEDTD